MKLSNMAFDLVLNCARDEEGAQIVEYGLIIAVVSLGLILLLKPLVTDSTGPFASMINKVTACLTNASTGCS